MRNLSCALVMCFWIAAPAAHSVAAEPEAAAEPEIDAAARAAIARAADFLRTQTRFAFSADVAYEVEQDDGTILEFGELRRYVLKRPDRLRIDSDRRADGKRTTFFDGARMTVWSPGQNAYAFVKLKQHRDIDEALLLLRDRLGIPVPLGELLASAPAEGLDDTYDSAFVVGEEQLDGVTCEHLALRNEDTNLEIWIAKDAPPFVRRVHTVYGTLAGHPRFTARLFDWSLTPDVADGVFQFEPPKDAERVRFALGGSGTPPPPEKKETKP